jgi:hypothetical protein
MVLIVAQRSAARAFRRNPHHRTNVLAQLRNGGVLWALKSKRAFSTMFTVRVALQLAHPCGVSPLLSSLQISPS